MIAAASLIAAAGAVAPAAVAECAAQTTRPTAPSAPRLVARPTLRAGTLAGGGISVDGRLDEPAWLVADSVADLTQIEPIEGAVPSGRTVIRVLAAPDAIVVGIRADDPEPDRMTRFARERDASLDNEDHIKLVLDTYLDGRSGYVFAVNPNGARYDALVANQGEGENSNWDALWEAATELTPTGWAAEIRIPLKSLLFGRELSEWGLNVQRRIQRLQETDRWASPDRDVKIDIDESRGTPHGVAALRPRHRPERPAFGVGRCRQARPRDRLAQRSRREPRCEPAHRRQFTCIPHDQHRLRRDRGRLSAPSSWKARTSSISGWASAAAAAMAPICCRSSAGA